MAHASTGTEKLSGWRVLLTSLMTLALLLALAGSLVAMGVIVRRLDQA